ncbi:MAG: hypothetical protein JXB88_22735 [Spirochaetales bacterium]|nr:hypothetical protein [Spirochaetales bacterium]
MFGLKILDFILSLCFIFFLTSLLTSWIYELIAVWLKRRSVNLRDVLNCMIGGETGKNKNEDEDKKIDLLERLYEHPLVKEHTKKGNDPEYIPDKEFGFILLDIIKNMGESASGTGNGKKKKQKEKKEIDIDFLEERVTAIKNPRVREKLILFLNAARTMDGDINKKIAFVQKRFEDWFSHMMKRASDLYKQYASIVMFFIGLGIAGILNIDSLQLVNSLWYDARLSETVSNAAARYIEDSLSEKTDKDKKDMDMYRELDAIKQIPVGWNTYTFPENGDCRDKTLSIIFKIAGILISALAVSQGGPFWYDLLTKLIKLKKTVQQKKPEQQ